MHLDRGYDSATRDLRQILGYDAEIAVKGVPAPKWPYLEGPLKKLLARIRPEYVGIEPADRVVYEPGQVAQCDLWFPDTPIPVTAGQAGSCRCWW